MNGTPHSVKDAPEGRAGRLSKRTRSEITRVATSSKTLAGQSRGEASVATRLTIVETLQQRCDNFQISRIKVSPLSNITLYPPFSNGDKTGIYTKTIILFGDLVQPDAAYWLRHVRHPHIETVMTGATAD